jgi:hypothetical protein
MTFHKISVLIPTRKRIERLKMMIRSFETTTSGCSELIFRIDNDDLETADYLQTVPWRLKRGVFKGPRYEGYKSTGRFLWDMVGMMDGDVLMVGNDDMIFETPGWDIQVLRAANNFPDGIFDIGVETLNTSHYPFSIVSKKVVKQLGFVYDPRIFWGDIFLRDVMAAFDRTVLLPTVKVTHDWAGYKPDATFGEADHLKLTIGTAEYWQKNAEVVREAVEKLSGVLA